MVWRGQRRSGRMAAAQQATTNSLQAAQDFAANAAHELRTPLTAMRADLDTLRSTTCPSRNARKSLATAARTASCRGDHHRAWPTGVGQLAQVEDRELIDVTDMLDRVRGRTPAWQARSRSSSTPTTSASIWDGPVVCGWPWTTWCATHSARRALEYADSAQNW